MLCRQLQHVRAGTAVVLLALAWQAHGLGYDGKYISCPSQQVSGQEPWQVKMIDMEPGERRNFTLCQGDWQWYRVKPNTYTEIVNFQQIEKQRTRTQPYTVIEDGKTVKKYRTVAVKNSVVLTVEPHFFSKDTDLGEYRFATVNVIGKIGSVPEPYVQEGAGDKLVGGWNIVNDIKYPESTFGENGLDYKRRKPDKPFASGLNALEGEDFITWTAGYNESQPNCLTEDGIDNDIPGMDYVYAGVRCAWGLEAACEYDVYWQILPNELAGEDVIVAPINYGEYHFYKVEISDFDILIARFLRVGKNLTFTDTTTIPPTEVSNGNGFTGSFLVKRGGCPSIDDYEKAVAVGNVTYEYEIEYFCSDQAQKGQYVFKIQADPTFGPDAQHVVVPGSAGYVGPYEAPIDTSVFSNAPPAFAPGGEPNELKKGRGYYQLSIIHTMFHDGGMAPGEVRQGCVSYGQWRYYSIVTPSLAETSLFLEISKPVSGIYVRLNKRPTPQRYDSLAEHGTSTVSLSPCKVDYEYQWHFAITMFDEYKAQSRNHKPDRYTLQTRLENTVKQVGDRVEPKSKGGYGYVCCGNFKYYKIMNVPGEKALSVQLNVTSGNARAVWLKQDTCPRYPEDLGPGDECLGMCHTVWYTKYNQYTGSLHHNFSLVNTVPHKLVPYTAIPRTGNDVERSTGPWYLGIQALSGDFAQYEFEISLQDRPIVPYVFTCDRYAKFCPQEQKEAKTIIVEEPPLGAPPQSGARPLLAGWLLWWVVPCCLVVMGH